MGRQAWLRVWIVSLCVIGLCAVDGGAARAQRGDNIATLSRQVTELQNAGKYAEALPLAERVAALVKARRGEASADYATALEQVAVTYFFQSRYTDAEPVYQQVLALREKANGPEHPSALAVLDSLASIYRFSNRPQLAEPLLKRTLAIRERTSGPDHPTVAIVLRNLADIEVILQNYDAADAHIRRAIALAEKINQSPSEIARMFSVVAKIELAQARIEDAERSLKRSLALHETASRTSRPDANASISHMFTLMQLSGLYQQSDRYQDSMGVSERVLAMMEKLLGPDHPTVATQLEVVASAYGLLGRYGEAEGLRKRAIAINERASGQEHLSVALSLQGLGQLYRLQERYDEAEPLLKRAMALAEKLLGTDHPGLTPYLSEIANLYRSQRRNAEAEPLFQRVLANLENAKGADPLLTGVQMISTLDSLAALNFSQGRYDQALPYFERVLALSERIFGPEHSMTGSALRGIGLQVLDQGRVDEAERYFQRALPMAEKAGRDDVGYADTISGLAMVAFKRNDWARAHEMLNQASQIYLTLDQRRGSSKVKGAANSPSVPHAEVFLMQATTAYSLAETTPALADTLRDEAFQMVQRAQSSQAAGALTQMAARFATGGGALGGLVRERQDLGAEWQGLDARLTAELSASAADRSAPREETLRKRLTTIVRRLDDLDARMTKEFPAYAALANPQPLTITDAQKYLAQNEALVVIANRLHQSLVWVVTKSDARWALAPLGEEELGREVAALRCGLDATAWKATGASSCASLLGVSLQAGQPLPFDLVRAHALYDALLRPFADILGDKHLLVAASGPLTALPLSVLVTEPPPSAVLTDAARYADVAWLAKRHATSVLPSVASFASLRAVARPSAARNTFIGFGNPLLQGPDGRNRDAWARVSCSRPPPNNVMRVAERAIPQGISKFFRGPLANVEALRQQSPLPETAEELCIVARGLGTGDRDVYLGSRATETMIKALNDRGQLADYRVVHFATHGLLSGESESLGFGAEPALLLTPPATATEGDDGLLTASEVAKLRLDADWVVLSACNTAGAAKAGAQPFSGLARAFFYAGARALLVSHWYVESDAAVKLMTGAFAEAHRNPAIGRAEAVRRAMLAVMADGSQPSSWSAAHPSVWAPFVVVGEGGAVR